MAEPKEDSVFFVGLKYPVELRRTILEMLKDVVDDLHKFEKFKESREAKVRETENLKTAMKEIDKLMAKLKNALPKTNIRVRLHDHERLARKREEEKKRALDKGKKKEAREETRKESTQLERLESELDAIESKLKDLG
ncbi:hypothetical protein J4453_02310 [Candidatus Woesearchaeota archaeon]|nr:hypothetical protein [Candidatus Woesearchaeota archaeon]